MNLQIIIIDNVKIGNGLNKERILFNKIINLISYDKHSCSNLMIGSINSNIFYKSGAKR